MIVNMTGGGGGAGLNFKVVGNPQPSNPAENTIWVNTDTEITSWAFMATAPASPTNGMVWIETSASSPVPFNALKKNVIQVLPARCKQYIDGAWVEKTAKTWQGGKWLNWTVYLFNGEVNEALTGGINGTIADGVIDFPKTSIGSGNNKTYSTVNAVDISDFTSIHARFVSSNTISSVFFRLAVLEAEANGTNITTGKLIAYVGEAGPFNGEEKTAVLDVSALTGSYYLAYAWGVPSSSSSPRDVNGKILEWWLE